MKQTIYVKPMASIFFCIIITNSSCSGSGGVSNIIKSLVCSSGHQKNSLTLGMNLDILQKLGINTSNSNIKNKLNEWLTQVGFSSSILAVKNVESVGKSNNTEPEADDKFRFLTLSGTLGEFGFASEAFKKISKLVGSNLALDSNLALTQENSLFPDIKESFNMQISANNVPHNNQWVFKQTNYSTSIEKLIVDKSKLNNVIVAVIDTGVNLTHPDLQDILISGKDFTGGSSPEDKNGHGTHCAGIIAAQGKNADSPVGVAKELASLGKLKIMPIKVLGDDGSGSSQNIDKGIKWAVDNGANIISMSLGGAMEYNDALKQGVHDPVIKYAIDKGVIVIVAAGNEGCPLGGECNYGSGGLFGKKFDNYFVTPCSDNNTICVGATNPDETLATYSNYSSKKAQTNDFRSHADVNAPGTHIYSTWPITTGKNYHTISGTSMATPYVAGIAAWIKSIKPSITQAEMKTFLQSGQIYPNEIKEKSEVGRVDFAHVTNKLMSSTGTADAPAPKPVEDIPVPEESNNTATLMDFLCK